MTSPILGAVIAFVVFNLIRWLVLDREDPALQLQKVGQRPNAPADAVLLDAPCTATGTIRRHPDVPYAKSPALVKRQAATQEKLLRAAADMVAPGGVLVYSVCSLQPEEGAQRIAAFLGDRTGFVRLPVSAHEVGGQAAFITQAGDVQTLPCHLAEAGGIDGFFIARLRRR